MRLDPALAYEGDFYCPIDAERLVGLITYDDYPITDCMFCMKCKQLYDVSWSKKNI